MPEPRFFRLIKSANVLIFFGVGLLLLSVLGYAAYQIYRDTFRDRAVSDVMNVSSPAPGSKTQVSLGAFTPIEGTPYYFAPISAEQDYRQDYYDKATTSTRNYLMLNVMDKSSVRLVPKNDQLFLTAEKLGQKGKAGSLVKVQGLMYQVVKADTNGDKRLTEMDQKAIALSEPSGKNYTEVVPRVDRLLGTVQTKPETVMLIYIANQKNLITEINIATRQVIATQELPAIE